MNPKLILRQVVEFVGQAPEHGRRLETVLLHQTAQEGHGDTLLSGWGWPCAYGEVPCQTHQAEFLTCSNRNTRRDHRAGEPQ
jgi:hypothetical protein